MPVVPATQKAEVGGSHEFGDVIKASVNSDDSLHYSMGDTVRPCLKNK